MQCKSLWIKASAKCINVNVKDQANLISHVMSLLYVSETSCDLVSLVAASLVDPVGPLGGEQGDIVSVSLSHEAALQRVRHQTRTGVALLINTTQHTHHYTHSSLHTLITTLTYHNTTHSSLHTLITTHTHHNTYLSQHNTLITTHTHHYTHSSLHTLITTYTHHNTYLSQHTHSSQHTLITTHTHHYTHNTRITTLTHSSQHNTNHNTTHSTKTHT